MRNRQRRVHDWRLLKWPFTVTFLYYSLLMLVTGSAEASEIGFAGVLGLALLMDAAIYFFYCFFLSRDGDDPNKLWAVFVLFYGLLTLPQLQALWELMKAHAVI
ncbi:MAG: hypothetical protein IJV43_07815 [Oscillospiraceae bacterium]|nr:hypothetical protein [Oscillospiraceae bacterium]